MGEQSTEIKSLNFQLSKQKINYDLKISLIQIKQ
jgi:hypothetical protein